MPRLYRPSLPFPPQLLPQSPCCRFHCGSSEDFGLTIVGRNPLSLWMWTRRQVVMILLALKNGEVHCNNNFRGMGLEPGQNISEAWLSTDTKFLFVIGHFLGDFPLFSIIHSIRYNCLARLIFTSWLTSVSVPLRWVFVWWGGLFYPWNKQKVPRWKSQQPQILNHTSYCKTQFGSMSQLENLIVARDPRTHTDQCAWLSNSWCLTSPPLNTEDLSTYDYRF